MKRRFSLILAVLLTLSLLAGCGGKDAPETTAPVNTPETTAPAEAPETTAPVPETTEPALQERALSLGVVEGNTYWLTETPEENSVMPGTDWPRVYTYAVLKDKVTGESFMHLNTHLDTAGSNIRLAEVLLLMEFLEDYNDLPVILSGDLNAKADSTEMQTLFKNQFIQPLDALEDAKDQKPTFYIGDCVIDYVLITNDCLEMLNYRVEGERIYGDYASDHNAIYIDFKFRDLEGEINHGWREIQTGYPDEWLDVEKESEADDAFGGVHLIP